MNFEVYSETYRRFLGWEQVDVSFGMKWKSINFVSWKWQVVHKCWSLFGNILKVFWMGAVGNRKVSICLWVKVGQKICKSYTRPGLSCFSVTASLVKMLSLVESVYQQRVTMCLWKGIYVYISKTKKSVSNCRDKSISCVWWQHSC